LVKRSVLSAITPTKGKSTSEDSSTIRSYIGALAEMASWKLAFVSLLMFCVSLTEGVGILLLVPLLQVVGLDIGSGAVGKIGGFISSVFSTVGAQPTLILVLGLYVLIITVRAFLSSWQLTTINVIVHGFKVHLRQQLYRAIVNTDWLFFSRSRSSDFTHALTSEVDRVGRATRVLLKLIGEVGVAAVYILVAAYLSVTVSALACVSAAALLLIRARECNQRARA
jgi:ATP-binding cassette subfamily C protein